jgi:hypothetical protein
MISGGAASIAPAHASVPNSSPRWLMRNSRKRSRAPKLPVSTHRLAELLRSSEVVELHAGAVCAVARDRQAPGVRRLRRLRLSAAIHAGLGASGSTSSAPLTGPERVAVPAPLAIARVAVMNPARPPGRNQAAGARLRPHLGARPSPQSSTDARTPPCAMHLRRSRQPRRRASATPVPS